jgi:hypothetical protein
MRNHSDKKLIYAALIGNSAIEVVAAPKEIASSYADWMIVVTCEVEKKPVFLPGNAKHWIKLKQ